MAKLSRNDFRETVTMLLSAHIASQRGDSHNLRDISDEVLDDATKLAVKIFDRVKKFPRTYKKSINFDVIDFVKGQIKDTAVSN